VTVEDLAMALLCNQFIWDVKCSSELVVHMFQRNEALSSSGGPSNY